MNILKTGIHVFVMLLIVSLAIRFVITVDGFLLECSIFSILCGIPLYIIVDATYLIACAIKKRTVHIVFSVLDPVVIIASIALWGCVAYFKPFPMLVKAMPNLMESGLLMVLYCAFLAVRCYHAFVGNVEKMTRWQWLSFTILPIVAVLLALFFPTLPE
ncbi:MAG: hypothetical protein IKE23_01550 [Exiguobacterium sp.]|nr:hypothetical protein [Exiguobacterium sp.]